MPNGLMIAELMPNGLMIAELMPNGLMIADRMFGDRAAEHDRGRLAATARRRFVAPESASARARSSTTISSRRR